MARGVPLAPVEALDFGQALTEAGFADTPNPVEPDKGACPPPGAFNEVEPEMPLHHMQV